MHRISYSLIKNRDEMRQPKSLILVKSCIFPYLFIDDLRAKVPACVSVCLCMHVCKCVCNIKYEIHCH
jgi:hypothetical protein